MIRTKVKKEEEASVGDRGGAVSGGGEVTGATTSGIEREGCEGTFNN